MQKSLYDLPRIYLERTSNSVTLIYTNERDMCVYVYSGKTRERLEQIDQCFDQTWRT